MKYERWVYERLTCQVNVTRVMVKLDLMKKPIFIIEQHRKSLPRELLDIGAMVARKILTLQILVRFHYVQLYILVAQWNRARSF